MVTHYFKSFSKVGLSKKEREVGNAGLLFLKSSIYFLFFLIFYSCQQEEIIEPVVYSGDIYELKEYKVERHPPIVRNGFGMDFYHLGNSGFDTLYFSSGLPAWHPNNPQSAGVDLKRYDEASGDSIEFNYDLLFFNEFAYSVNYAGDYTSTGFPVIFMYTDPENANNSTKALLVGLGIDCFNNFTADNITLAKIDSLQSDPLINLPLLRTEIHSSSVDGSIMLRDSVYDLYQSLTIGNKFRPNIGGIISDIDADDEKQIYYQPVFLVRTREGKYAKFMVTRFKGTGTDTQKLTLQWQAIKEE
jgi:hypothetical protein